MIGHGYWLVFRERAPAGGRKRITESLVFGRVSEFIYDRK